MQLEETNSCPAVMTSVDEERWRVICQSFSPCDIAVKPRGVLSSLFSSKSRHSIRWASVKKINHIPAKNMTDIHLVDKWPLKILLETFKVCVAILKAFLLGIGYLFFNVLWLFSSSHFLFSRDHAPFWQTLLLSEALCLHSICTQKSLGRLRAVECLALLLYTSQNI